MRAQELGQPLTCRVIGPGRLFSMSASRRSSSWMAPVAVSLVSTIASLQNSMPVHAMVERRKREGRVVSPSSSSAARRESTRSAATSRMTSFWCGVVRRRAGAGGSRRSAGWARRGAGQAAQEGGDTEVKLSVALPVHADVIGFADRNGCGGAIRKRCVEVFGLKNFPKLHGAPLGEQELQPSLVSQATVPVITENLCHSVPHIGYSFGCDEDSEPVGEPGRGGEPASHPQVVSDPEFRVLDGDECAVVALVYNILAGMPRNGS